MRRLLLVGLVALASTGCVTPLSRFQAWRPGDASSQTTSLYDWRCVTTTKPSTVFWTNDPGVHSIRGVVTDRAIVCTFVTAAENCQGAPPAQYVVCLHDGGER